MGVTVVDVGSATVSQDVTSAPAALEGQVEIAGLALSVVVEKAERRPFDGDRPRRDSQTSLRYCSVSATQ